MRLSYKFKRKIEKIFLFFLILVCSFALFAGISIAYTNSKALAFGDETGVVSLQENNEGDIVVSIFDRKINVSRLASEKFK